MSESLRRTGTRESHYLPSIRTGIEGFADGMRIFPRLKEWESQIALKALREKKTVQDLRSVTPFRQYLGVDRRAHLAEEQSPFHAFTTLFYESPSIDMLVSLGNFHTIRSWTWTLAKQYPDLNLPLEQFFQDALYRIAPTSARLYDPSIGNPFQNYLTELLKKRFRNFVITQKREMSSPVGYEEKPHTKKGKPTASRERVMVASLETPINHTDISQTLFEYVEMTRPASQQISQTEDHVFTDKIHQLAQLAGLNEIQEETLVALFVHEETTTCIAEQRRRTSRMVRKYRQTALESIQKLGYETVQGILTGSNI
jgi:hypothetical protein